MTDSNYTSRFEAIYNLDSRLAPDRGPSGYYSPPTGEHLHDVIWLLMRLLEDVVTEVTQLRERLAHLEGVE